MLGNNQDSSERAGRQYSATYGVGTDAYVAEEGEYRRETDQVVDDPTPDRTLITINNSYSELIGIFIRFPYYPSALLRSFSLVCLG